MAAAKSSPTKDELLQPVNGYQLQAVSEKIDGLTASQAELKTLLLANSATYPTRTELALELEKRDARILALTRTLANYGRVVWSLVSAVVPMIAIGIWQLMINASGGR